MTLAYSRPSSSSPPYRMPASVDHGRAEVTTVDGRSLPSPPPRFASTRAAGSRASSSSRRSRTRTKIRSASRTRCRCRSTARSPVTHSRSARAPSPQDRPQGVRPKTLRGGARQGRTAAAAREEKADIFTQDIGNIRRARRSSRRSRSIAPRVDARWRMGAALPPHRSPLQSAGTVPARTKGLAHRGSRKTACARACSSRCASPTPSTDGKARARRRIA